MQKHFAVINQGRVTNIIVWDPATAPEWKYPGEGELVPVVGEAGIGWAYDGEKFIDDRAVVEADVNLASLKVDAVAEISRTFTQVVTALFFDGDVEALRVKAKERVAQIQAAETIEVVNQHRVEAIQELIR